DYAQAVKLSEAAAAKDVDARRNLAAWRCALAGLLPNNDDATRLFEQALADGRDLHRQLPTDPDCRFDLARTSHQFAVFLLKTEKAPAPRAEALLRDELKLLESLVADCPAIADYRVNLAKCHRSLADFYLRSRRAADAVSHLKRAVEILEKLVLEFPGVLPY